MLPETAARRSLAWAVAFVAPWWPIVRAMDRRRLYLGP
jgi:hypothetical protein